ncbi:SDR family NAD(P)-dependent oxidoreductase [Stigmatella sp. ncwal1]|uniref:SDR family NAD(P)-dependent oxidoreductase n=1 Tax=Stigmatella ashevillensis TaxID=2995309 RepID=A0ABT5DC28_9BACT|nr:SDR family oxidoreductase [Stigmatella ashevillena]MDC0711188.1 SDR family NAD(P)-dependent oxidoreductase [Stigmatella ashevillena]
MAARNAIVVGGTGDIGTAVIRKLRAEGLRTVCASNDVPQDIGDTLRVDITDEASVAAMFEKVEKELGPIGLLVNCAGIGIFTPIQETSIQDWRKTLDVNLTGAFLCSREAFKRMKEQGGGRIIHIGSVSDHLALPMNAAYAASKHGVRGLTGILNEEGKAYSIRATLISLGAVYTSIWHTRPEFSPDDMLPIEEVAQSIWEIARKPLNVRVDEIRLLPPKGVL